MPHFQNFIEAEHGKGEYDGARACLKRALSREELKYEGGTILQYAKIIVQQCNSIMGLGHIAKSIVSIYFWLICETNIDFF